MTRLNTLAVLVAVCGGAFAADPPPPSDADRMKALEKQVADLKKEVSELREQLKLPPKPALENKLIGSWGMDKPADAKFVGVVAVELKEDGTCQVVVQDKNGKNQRYTGKHKAVGKVVELKLFPFAEDIYLHVVSVDEKELVAKGKGETYPEHDVKLQRQ